MKIVIIGWYGTETIGDRAILSGLLSFFSKTFNDFEIELGSLYPFFSQRTIVEDLPFYKEVINSKFKIKIFDSKDSNILSKKIKDCDFLVMGGGPLMDLQELYMINYAFKKAKKIGKKTALLGCGIGPLFISKYKKIVCDIINKSDLTILRDDYSKESMKNLFKTSKKIYNGNEVLVSLDPAVECCINYKKLNKCVDYDENPYIAINIRDYPEEYGNSNKKNEINNQLFKFIRKISSKYNSYVIKLIPMHYFHIGNDDRVILNSIALNIATDNLYVQNKNLSLKETLAVFTNSYFNIGMRFHSVVLQTILNGKNYVLDYTEPDKGKIGGFFNSIDESGFYNNRIWQLQEKSSKQFILKQEDNKFEYNQLFINNQLNIYTTKLKELFQ